MAVPQDSIIRLTLMLMLFDNLTIIYTWLNIKIDRFQDIKSAADIGNEFQFVLNWVETCPIKFNGSKLKKKIYIRSSLPILTSMKVSPYAFLF